MLTIQQLQTFCAVNDSREHRNKPHRIGDFVYALNGYMVIRVPFELVTGIEAGSLSSAAPESNQYVYLFDNRKPVGERIEIPKPVRTVENTCLRCDGKGKDYEARHCEDCNGNGEFTHGEHIYSCKECDGSGKKANYKEISLTCDTCLGSLFDKYKAAPVGKHYYDMRYLAIASALPNVRIEASPEKDTSLVKFFFDDGEGFITIWRN
jgi:hypothetical protein